MPNHIDESLRRRLLASMAGDSLVLLCGAGLSMAKPSELPPAWKVAQDLLDLAIERDRHNQRLLFFCGCPCPKYEGKLACHRSHVARLVLKAARKRGVNVEIVEWPGGKPRRIDLDAPPELFCAVEKGRMSIPLGKGFDLAEFAGLPWCSIATLHSGGEKLHRLVGPAMSQTDGWVLPVLCYYFDPATGVAEYKQEAARDRKSWGYEPLHT